ncbi:CRISPR-associated endonuclease Cas3'' [Streptomyces virginiae]|uniref:CRISPR-associated endonuclease Cas3'' n=1 Tax=Streptomyces virginiae TaxID=1961 RepID=UPI0038072E28
MSSEDGSALPALDCCLWGKEQGLPRAYPVVCHLLDTAAVFGELWDGLLSESMRGRISGDLGLAAGDARAVLSFWAGLHDIGKISPPFQAQVPELFEGLKRGGAYEQAPGAERLRLRHEAATHWALTGLFAEVGYGSRRLLRLSLAHQVAQLLGGHHGSFGQVLPAGQLAAVSVYQPGLGGRGWAEQRRAHFAELRRVTGAWAVPAGSLSAACAVVVAGLVIVSDWLASATEHIVPLLPPGGWRGTAAEVEGHWRRTRLEAPAVVAAARVGRAQFGEFGFEEVFPFAPNPLQADLVEGLPRLVGAHGPGLLLVTAPTGEGKTEAAFHAAGVLGRASGARGVFVALPTMATADAMFPRLRAYAERAVRGERALTLLHSMAWLSPGFQGSAVGAEWVGSSADRGSAVEAGAWLRGRHRALLAPLGVGTVDQVLGGVLPLPFNVLRLFGLSDKVLVVDEAHAYGPWMHQLLVRLLEWLGAFGAPVVLLSATLTGRSAGSLVNAYRRGAGFGEAVPVEPRYPGWVFVGARTGDVAEPRGVGSVRRRVLDVVVRPVRWFGARDVGEGGARRRLGVLCEELRVVADGGGCALVCCTTVAEAQRTFRELRECFPELVSREGGLRLLHSRFPASVRGRVSAGCQAAYGKAGVSVAGCRPGSVLVATQVVEQSLDLDFDLVVSDLAPLAQLLQRAGRARRHARGRGGRPVWAWPEDRPRLVVLEPVDAEGCVEVPRAWGSVYDAGLLHRTARLLASEAAGGIVVPDDVQRLVDAVYAEGFTSGLEEAVAGQLRQMDEAREAGAAAEAYMATLVEICAPADVAGDLFRLSRCEAGVTQELLTTRLGADSGRVVCFFDQGGGRFSLDEDGRVAVPGGRPSPEETAAVVSGCIPVPGAWLRGAGEGGLRPGGWRDRPLLRELVPVRVRRGGDGSWSGGLGDHTVRLSEVGLERL